MENIYHNVLRIVKTSAIKGDVEQITPLIKGVCAFAGQSAVGKSSLINAIFNQKLEEVGDFSKKVDKGKQTTRMVTLYKRSAGFIADTAGFSKLDESLIDLNPNEISRYYPDMIDFVDKCKFRSCLHKDSNNCAVFKAVNESLISSERYENYLKFLDIKLNSIKVVKK